MIKVCSQPFTAEEKREATFLCEIVRTVVPQLRATLRSKMVILSDPGTRPAIAVNSNGAFVKIDWTDQYEYLEVIEVVRACPDLRVVLDRLEEALSDGHSPAAVTVHCAKDALDPRGVPRTE